MKQVRIMGLALAILALTVFSANAQPPPTLLSRVDLGTAGDAGARYVTYFFEGGGGTCSSFNPQQIPGDWGGAPNAGAVTAFPGDQNPAGHCILVWERKCKARRIVLRVLDGIADDSFNVYVSNRLGAWVLAYSYVADPSKDEVWIEHEIRLPNVEGLFPFLHLMIVPTNVGWDGYNTWGQLAVDYIELYDR